MLISPVKLIIVCLLFLTVGGVSLFAINKIYNKEISHYAQGKLLYREYSCDTCHGEAGMKPIRRSALKTAPSLFDEWLKSDEILATIRFGSFEEDYQTASTLNHDRLKMPPYVLYLEQAEQDALVVYIQANQLLNDAQIKKSSAMKVAVNAGCFGCHGALGQGGAVNPKSVKNAIPGWFGADFDALTAGGDREFVRQWIEQGTSEAITNKSVGLGTVAQWFLSRQAIKMPAYKTRLSEQDITLLVDLVLSVRKSGDLSIKAVSDLKTHLDVSPEEKAVENPADDELDFEMRDF